MHYDKNGYGEFWYDDNWKYHRDDGPAIIFRYGVLRWYQHGKIHRDDGPAIMKTSGCVWYQYGKIHRLDGPANESANGHKEWFINGEKIICKDNEEFLRIVKMKVLL
jgi:hypothetical protein